MSAHTIKILGTGCRSCVRTFELVDKLVTEAGLDAHVVKEEDLRAIMGYGVMATPGVVIDDKVVHAGGVPSPKAVKGWLAALG